MTARKGGRGKCATCGHPDQAQINADLINKVSLAKISAQYGISESSLKAHKANHISPSLKSIHTDAGAGKKPFTKESGNQTILRLERMIATVENILHVAQGNQDVNGNFQSLPNMGQALSAVRELRATIELLARITGELDERPTTVINLLTTPAWVQARTAIIEALVPYDEARLAVSNRLQLLEGNS